MWVEVIEVCCGACGDVWYELSGEVVKACPHCGENAQEATDNGAIAEYRAEVDRKTGEVTLVQSR